MTKTNGKKLLSVVLSIIMVFSVISVAFVNVVPTANAAAITDAQWNALIDALKLPGVKDTQFESDGDNAVKADDPSGNLLIAAEAYYDAFNQYKALNGDQNNTSSRTAVLVNNHIKSQLTTKMGNDYSAYNVATLLSGFIANYNDSNGYLSGTNIGGNSRGNVTLTVTITNSSSWADYSSADDLPNNIPSGYKYTYTHTTASYRYMLVSTRYYATLSSVSRSEKTMDFSSVVTLRNEIAANSSLYGADFSELVELGEDNLKNVQASLGAAYYAVLNSTAFKGSDVYSHFFADYDTDTLLENIDAAIKVQTYIDLAKSLQEKTAIDISDYDFEQLTSLYKGMKSDFDIYKAAPFAARDYIESQGILVVEEVQAKFDEIENAYEIAYLRDVLKPRIENDLDTYAGYDDDWTIATDGVEGIIAAAEIELESVISDLNSRKAENVIAVFGENYIADAIQPVLDRFARIREVNNYNLDFKKYQNDYNAAFAPLTLEESSAELLKILNDNDSWYSELKAFAAELSEYDAELASKILTDAEAAMEEKINLTYAALNAILESEINNAWALYQNVKAEYGTVINEVTMENYISIRNSVGLIEVNVYNFLAETVHFNLSDAAVEKYEELKNIVFALNNYSPSKTLSAYKFNAETLDPIIRYVKDGDMIRDKDFIVKDEYMQDIIDLLNKVLAGGLSDLGVDFNFADTLDSLWDLIYSDSFVNTIMGALYPLLTELVRDYLKDLAGDAISYLTDPDDAFDKLNVSLAPSHVAKHIDAAKYPNIRSALSNVPGGFMDGSKDDGSNCWNSATAKANLYKPVLDENGEQLRDENGALMWSGDLKFDWGIDALESLSEKKEATLDALDVSLNALEPVLLTLLCKKNIGSQTIISIPLVASLSLGTTGNDGYNNALVPIFEALGVHPEAIYNGQTFTRVREVFEFGLLSPIEDLFAQIKEDPAGKIVDLLPTLAFAIQNDLIINLLHELHLYLNLSSSGIASGCVDSLLGDAMNGVDLDLGKEIKLDNILDNPDFYTEVTSVDGIIRIVLSLLISSDEEAEEGEEPDEPAQSAPELKLPHFDGAQLAMLGTDVVWGSSYRSNSIIWYEDSPKWHANIVANRPQVVQFLLEYVIEAAKDPDLIPAILAMVNKDKEEDKQVSLPDIVDTLLGNVKESGTDVIAAVFELLNPVYRYTMPDGIQWIKEGNIGATDYDDKWTNVDADGNRTLWTKEKAVYLAEHLEDFLNDIVVIFGEQLGGAETLGDAVDYLLSSLFTADNANALVSAIKDLIGGLLGTDDENDESSDDKGGADILGVITDLGLLDQLGIDLNAWDDLEYSFADGDKKAFKNALIEILSPLNPLLAFILAEKDIELDLLGLADVTAVGYDGYSWGIVPLLEALGATGLKSTSAFIKDRDNVVKNIVDPLFSIVDKIQKNPLKTIEELVPSLLYFVKVEGIQVAAEHLLTSVNVLLDIIRPVYDVDIYKLASDELGIDLRFAETDPINFIFIKINDLLRDKFEIDLGLDFTVDSLTQILHFTDPQAKTSANGQGRYTISLTTEGKADLISNVLNFGINQIIFGENYEELVALLMDIITDDDTRALVRALLDIINDADGAYADFHGVYDVTLSSLFWIFFGADSVTDAVSDFFYRHKDSNFFEILFYVTDKAPDYVERARFLIKEAYRTEFPAAMDIIENSGAFLKPPYEYTEEEQRFMSRFIARLVVFFEAIFNFFRSLTSK
ncbi:MAG: hypothetical protein J1E34_07555 [Oscillospiraceae bacterium]|nr:hypothetical protein [Oscillospiraceae bacterium]